MGLVMDSHILAAAFVLGSVLLSGAHAACTMPGWFENTTAAINSRTVITGSNEQDFEDGSGDYLDEQDCFRVYHAGDSSSHRLKFTFFSMKVEHKFQCSQLDVFYNCNGSSYCFD